MNNHDILISELSELYDVIWSTSIESEFDVNSLAININTVCLLFENGCVGYYRTADLIDIWFQRWLYTKLQKTLVFPNDKNTTDIVFEKININFFNRVRICILENPVITNNNGNVYKKEKIVVATYVLTERLQNVFELVKASASFLNYRPAIAKTLEETQHVADAVLNAVSDDIEGIKSDNKKSFNKYVAKLKKKTESDLNSLIKHSSESSITILGIFMGVVMVFFGGFTILENSIEGLSSASYHRLYFTMLLFGGILYNIVILLFFLIGRVTERSIACKCHKSEDNNCSKCKRKVVSKTICSLQNKFPYIFWVDFLIVLGMGFIVVLYYCARILPQIEALHISRAVLCVLTIFIVLGAGIVFNFCMFLIRTFIVFLINQFKKE